MDSTKLKFEVSVPNPNPDEMQLDCPHCRNPFELSKTDPGELVTCQECGSSFHLESGATVDWRPSGKTGKSHPNVRTVGKFELLEAVGQGAFGTVYRARDAELDRTVAIKIPRTANVPEAQYLDRFLREARSAAQLRHESIVAVHEVAQQDGMPLLVSDFVEGTPLDDVLGTRPPSTKQAAEWTAAIADAVNYAHQQGVIHRDLKPANVMIRPDGSPCVMDFGLAKREAGEITMTTDGQVLGTPAYMSPEQAKGESHQVDGRSDIYSLGVMLYQMLTGELPFRGTTRMLMHQVLHDEPRAPRSLNDRIPRDIETICLRAMAKEPDRRYQTAAALAEDLRRWLCGEPIHARPLGRFEQCWRWARRNPAMAGLLATIALSLMVVFGLSVSFGFYQSRVALEQAKQKRNAQTRSADLALDEAIRLCESDDIGAGMLRMGRSLELAPADATGLQHVARMNLAGWRRRLHALQMMLPHNDKVLAVAVGPKGKIILTGCADRGARIWDRDLGSVVRTFECAEPVRAVAVGPDGRRVITCSGAQADLWDATNGELLGRFKGHAGTIIAVAYAPDGSRVVTGSEDGTARLWDADEALEIRRLDHEYSVRSVAFSPTDAAMILTAGGADEDSFIGDRLIQPGGEIRLWDVSRDLPVWKRKFPRSVSAVAFDSHGTTLLSGHRNSEILVLDPTTGKTTSELDLVGERIRSVSFSPDGSLIAAGRMDSFSAEVRETKTLRRFGSPLIHQGQVNAVAFAPVGRVLVTGSDDNTVRVWELAPLNNYEANVQHPGKGKSRWADTVCFSPDGNYLLTATRDETAQFWRVELTRDGVCIARRGGPFRHQGRMRPRFSPDSKTLLTGGDDGSVRRWKVPTQSSPEPIELWQTADLGPLTRLAISHDGNWFLAATEHGNIHLGEVVNGEIKHVFMHDRLSDMAFSSQSRTVTTAGYDGTVRRWDVSSGKEIEVERQKLLPPNVADEVSVSHDGQIVSMADMSGRARIYHVRGKTVDSMIRHEGRLWSATFSKSGRVLMTGSADKTARLWHTESGLPFGKPLRYPKPASRADFTDDDGLVVIGSDGHIARIWDVATSKPVGEALLHENERIAVALHPSGRYAATIDSGGVVRLWKIPVAVGTEVDRILVWTQVITGMQLDEDGTVRRLDFEGWNQRRKRLEELGGNPQVNSQSERGRDE